MNKVLKTVLVSIIAVLLVAVLTFAVIECWYLPRYAMHKERIVLNKTDTDTVRVMSCNVRVWAPDDLFTKSWFYRANLISQNISNAQPDIIGFQEVNPIHYHYFSDVLANYDSVIEYRDNSIIGEACPIFYRMDKFALVDKGSFWLSETPDTMSKDWGSKCYRICSYVILQQKTNGQKLVVFNTHLDHVSDEARIKGIEVVLNKIEEFGGYPALIMGDFNATPISATYLSATQKFYDAQMIATESMNSATYQNWGTELNRERIDYIMVSKQRIKVQKYQVIDTVYNGVYPSDHYPILAVIKILPNK